MSAFIDLIEPFIASVANGTTEIYNEFSLQHELGVFLRASLPNKKIRFERNVTSLFEGGSFIKREIDIVVSDPEHKHLDWAIELKYPRNGQYPEQMFSFCRDIVFAEQLKAAGFKNAALLVLVDSYPFFRGPAEGIYRYFRGRHPLSGCIQKPTGTKDSEVTIRGSYALEWTEISDPLRYLAVEV